MKKEIKINFSYTDHEWLVRFFEDGLLYKWEIFTDTEDIKKAIQQFYFSN